MEPTAQTNGNECATCGPTNGSPTAKPDEAALYLRFGLGQGYPQDIRHRRQCCCRPVVRSEESIDCVTLYGVCMPRVTQPIGVGSPRSEPCFGGALWNAAHRVCFDLGAVSLPLKLQTYAIARAPHGSDEKATIWDVGLFLDRRTLVLELDLATNARLAERCHV